jgi:hypothetical protein
MDNLLDGRSEISDLRDFPLCRAAEWARIAPEKKNPNRRLTQIYSASVSPAPDRSEVGSLRRPDEVWPLQTHFFYPGNQRRGVNA